MNELHRAASSGSTERTVALLSRGVIGINEGNSVGFTPLMLAATLGHYRVAMILLNKGADVAVAAFDSGTTALHCSVQGGYLAVTKLLVKAGSDLEAKATEGSTPLGIVVGNGHVEVMGVLIEAGADPNSRNKDETTPLFQAALNGHVDAVKLLLRAEADPLLKCLDYSSGCLTLIPLDGAAHNGHWEVVHELIQEHGIEGCGGETDGVRALYLAARTQHVRVLEVLIKAGVVDTGLALQASAAFGRESSVEFLLQQREWNSSGDRAAYLNYCTPTHPAQRP